MLFASSKDNVVKQKSLLLESFEYLMKSSEDKNKLKRIILKNAASIKIANHLMNFDEKRSNVLQKITFKSNG